MDGTRIEVAFEQKDQVKALGARWDKEAKSWYIPAGLPLEPFAMWLGHPMPHVPVTGQHPPAMTGYGTGQSTHTGLVHAQAYAPPAASIPPSGYANPQHPAAHQNYPSQPNQPYNPGQGYHQPPHQTNPYPQQPHIPQHNAAPQNHGQHPTTAQYYPSQVPQHPSAGNFPANASPANSSVANPYQGSPAAQHGQDPHASNPGYGVVTQLVSAMGQSTSIQNEQAQTGTEAESFDMPVTYSRGPGFLIDIYSADQTEPLQAFVPQIRYLVGGNSTLTERKIKCFACQEQTSFFYLTAVDVAMSLEQLDQAIQQRVPDKAQCLLYRYLPESRNKMSLSHLSRVPDFIVEIISIMAPTYSPVYSPSFDSLIYTNHCQHCKEQIPDHYELYKSADQIKADQNRAQQLNKEELLSITHPLIGSNYPYEINAHSPHVVIHQGKAGSIWDVMQSKQGAGALWDTHEIGLNDTPDYQEQDEQSLQEQAMQSHGEGLTDPQTQAGTDQDAEKGAEQAASVEAQSQSHHVTQPAASDQLAAVQIESNSTDQTGEQEAAQTPRPGDELVF